MTYLELYNNIMRKKSFLCIGLDTDKLQAYIDLIPPAEISEDITNMYNFIIGKL